MRNLLGIARISRLPNSPFCSRDLSTSSNLNKSHYETLGVPSSASKKEIRDAYIEKSKVQGDTVSYLCVARFALQSGPVTRCALFNLGERCRPDGWIDGRTDGQRKHVPIRD